MTREEMLYFLSSVGVNEHKLIQTQQRIRVIDQEKAKLGQKRLFEAPPEKENVGKAAIHGIGDAFWALAPATIIVGVMALAAIVIMLLEVIPSLFGIGDYTISSLNNHIGFLWRKCSRRKRRNHANRNILFGWGRGEHGKY